MELLAAFGFYPDPVLFYGILFFIAWAVLKALDFMDQRRWRWTIRDWLLAIICIGAALAAARVLALPPSAIF